MWRHLILMFFKILIGFGCKAVDICGRMYSVCMSVYLYICTSAFEHAYMCIHIFISRQNKKKSDIQQTDQRNEWDCKCRRSALHWWWRKQPGCPTSWRLPAHGGSVGLHHLSPEGRPRKGLQEFCNGVLCWARDHNTSDSKVRFLQFLQLFYSLLGQSIWVLTCFYCSRYIRDRIWW